MNFVGFLTIVLGLCLCPEISAQSPDPNVVDTGYARYRGNLTFPNAVAYLGIPYAERPIGQRRFRAPLPLNTTRVSLEAGGNVVDASQYPNFCIQGALGGTCNSRSIRTPISHRRTAGDHGGAGSEDCLKVNIYVPAGAKRGDNCEPVIQALSVC